MATKASMLVDRKARMVLPIGDYRYSYHIDPPYNLARGETLTMTFSDGTKYTMAATDKDEIIVALIVRSVASEAEAVFEAMAGTGEAGRVVDVIKKPLHGG